MERLNLATYAKEIKSDYDSVVNGDLTYTVFTTIKDGSLKPTSKGTGDITDFVSEFEEGSVQYGIISVNPYGSDVKKLLLLGWCPDSAPLKSKISYAGNVAEVGKSLHYHVQVTARDVDDLDVKDLMKTVSDASGARYSIQSVAKATPPVQSFKPKPKSASPQPEPVTVKTTPIIKPKKPIAKPAPKADEWDGEEELEERDFNEKPLENVASAYKPTKVDITALRKGTDNSTSSTPSKPAAKEDKKEDAEPVLLKDRMTAYVSLNSDDGRLSSLPKPKVANVVSSRYQEKVVQPEFGKSSKVPVYDSFAPSDKSKLVGGASRAFGTQNGRTPAEIWAEKHGKFKEVAHDEAPVNADEVESSPAAVSNVQSKFSSLNVKDDEKEEDDWEVVPKPTLPVRSLPPAPKKAESEPEEESEPEPEQESEPEVEEEESEPEPEPKEPVPTPAAEQSTKKAVVEYEYEKDEDNEIGLVEGELIINIKFVDEDWWFGENSKGESGLFPASYVVLKEEEEEEEEKATPVAAAAPPPPKRPEPVAEPVKEEGPSAVAEYDYDATEDNELTFKEGDLITDIEMVDEDWWLGNLNGDRKLFPSNHVTLNE